MGDLARDFDFVAETFQRDGIVGGLDRQELQRNGLASTMSSAR